MRRLALRSAATTLALALAAADAAAQAPRITAKGDPSVKPDSIYRLAVAASTVPDQDAFFLLDDGVVRLEADGRNTETYRQIVQILKPAAAERYQEQQFSYSPQHQKLTINWVRVVKPDGTVISDAPTISQDADVPAAMGDPVYSDTKVRRISLSGVEAGTIVDYSWTIEDTKPHLPGDYFTSWSISTGLGVKRSRFILDAPEKLPLTIEERNLNFKRAEKVTGGRKVLTWATADLPRLEGEAFAADSNGVHMSVAVATLPKWEAIAAWYAKNASGRYTLAPAVREKARGMVAGAKTRADTVRALHRWVAQDVRYVSIALGKGGYVPRTPDEVLRTGFGDCKDKATLFVAALRDLGYEAYPVLLAAGGGVRRGLPTIAQFDHAIAAVKSGNGWEYTDLTASLVPYGELPYGPQGEFALIVRDDGRGEQVTLPRPPIAANRTVSVLRGALSPEGTFDGTWEATATGIAQSSLRGAFEHPLDSASRADGANALARRLFEEAEGDSLEGFDGKDLGATPRVRIRVKGAKATTKAGDMMLLTMPLPSMATLATSATELQKKPRKYPIDAVQVLGNGEELTEISITLPEGWQARLPQGVTATGPFGTYESSYAQQGRELRLTRRTTGAVGVLPPEKIADLATWMRQIAKDDAKYIVLEAKK